MFIDIVCSFWNWEETAAKGEDYQGKRVLETKKSNCLMALGMRSPRHGKRVMFCGVECLGLTFRASLYIVLEFIVF